MNIFNYTCDVFSFEIQKVDFQEKTEKTLKYASAECYITEDTNGYFKNETFKNENAKLVKISLPEKYEIKIGYEIFCEGENYRVEDVSVRRFTSGRAGSVLCKCIKIYG